MKYVTSSDYIDLTFAVLGILSMIAYYFYNYFFLVKNFNKLGDKKFSAKFGDLYDGYRTDTPKKWALIKITTWYTYRRFLTALNLVLFRHVNIFFQITINMLLSLADLAIKVDCNPYKDKLAGFMEKFNDYFVLFMSYFMYLFFDQTISQESKYKIGYVYIAIGGIVVIANVFVMFFTMFNTIVRWGRNYIKECKLKKAQEESKKKPLSK